MASAVRRAFRAAGKSGELISGIDLLASGAGNLNSGAADLYSGASDLKQRASQLSQPGRAEQQQPEPGRRRQSRIRNFIIHRKTKIRVQVEDTDPQAGVGGRTGAAGKAMTAEEYEQACASGLIDADTQAQNRQRRQQKWPARR